MLLLLPGAIPIHNYCSKAATIETTTMTRMTTITTMNALHELTYRQKILKSMKVS